MVVGAIVAVTSQDYSGHPVVMLATCSFLLSAPFFALIMTSFQVDLRSFLRKSPKRSLSFLGYFLVIHGLFGVGTGTYSLLQAFALTLYAGVPILLSLSVRSVGKVVWQDGLVVLAIWLPIEFKWLGAVWDWPPPTGAGPLQVFVATSIAVVCFGVIRNFSWVRIRLSFSAADSRFALLVTGVFLLVALSFGSVTGFIVWNPQLTLQNLVATPLAILFLIAIPEELLFRGLMQMMLFKRTGSAVVSVAVTSLIFGFSHANNGDWRFVVLATLAGLAYGLVYMRTQHLTPAILTHTLVDVVWVLFFMAPSS
jgi:hypothetical protein